MSKWRTGRKVGRTIYIQHGAEPTDHDELIGVLDTPELAQLAVDALNAKERIEEHRHSSIVTYRRRPRDLFRRSYWLRCSTCSHLQGPYPRGIAYLRQASE